MPFARAAVVIEQRVDAADSAPPLAGSGERWASKAGPGLASTPTTVGSGT